MCHSGRPTAICFYHGNSRCKSCSTRRYSCRSFRSSSRSRVFATSSEYCFRSRPRGKGRGVNGLLVCSDRPSCSGSWRSHSFSLARYLRRGIAGRSRLRLGSSWAPWRQWCYLTLKEGSVTGGTYGWTAYTFGSYAIAASPEPTGAFMLFQREETWFFPLESE